MTPHDLLSAFDGLSDASKSIELLRELVLQLAMRGKLVAQNLQDEPVSALLQKVTEQRSRVPGNGGRSHDKQLPPVSDETRQLCPPGWAMARLGTLASTITKGTTPTTLGFAYKSDGIRFIKVECIRNGRIDHSSVDCFIDSEAHAALFRSQLQAGDILFSIAGTIGKTCLVVKDDIPANTNQALAIIRGAGVVFEPAFLQALLDSFVAQRVRDRARGGGMANVSLEDLRLLEVPIPPRSEQVRIVARLDELMGLLGRLEAAQSTRDATRAAVRDAVLAALQVAVDGEDLEVAWERLSARLTDVCASSSDVPALQEAILELAVRGRLVPQDPAAESAENLLGRISDEKTCLANEGKLRRSQPRQTLKREEVPFTLPPAWVWCHLEDACVSITDGDHLPPPQVDKGVPFLTIGNVSDGWLDFSSTRFVPRAYFEQLDTYRRPTAGDLLYTVVGATYGRSVRVDRAPAFCVQRHIAIIRPSQLVLRDYLHYVLKSALVYAQASAAKTGSAQPTVALGPLRRFVIPLPPLEEQRRIVAKIEELVEILERLEKGLRAAQETQMAFAAAAVHHLDV